MDGSTHHTSPDIEWLVLLSNREQLPRSIDALQRSDPEVIELKSSTDRDLLERRGDDDLTGLGLSHDAGSEIDGDAADVVTSLFDFANVDPCAPLEAEIVGGVP